MSGHGAEVELPHDHDDPFTKRVALSVAVFAVVLAVASIGGKTSGKDMQTHQLNAFNEWNQYQSKSLRDVLYTQERETLEQTYGVLAPDDAAKLARDFEAAQKDRAKSPPEVSERQRQRLGYVATKLVTYQDEKQKLTDKAKGFTAQWATAHRKEGYFNYAELALQLAIVLASISMLSKARWPFATAIGLALVGAALTAGGYVIPEKMPGVHVPLVDPAHEAGHDADAKH